MTQTQKKREMHHVQRVPRWTGSGPRVSVNYRKTWERRKEKPYRWVTAWKVFQVSQLKNCKAAKLKNSYC